MLDNSHWQIPEHTYNDLKMYVKYGLPTGDFLYAVLTNDLMESAGRANPRNSIKLKEICGFIINEIPSPAWRTPEKVEAWIKHHGLKGLELVQKEEK